MERAGEGTSALTGFRGVSCFQLQTPRIEAIAHPAPPTLRRVSSFQRRRVMNRASTRIAVTALILGATSFAPVGAQSSGGQYRIDPVTLPGGGGPIAGGNYQITSSLGQPATGVLRGASYLVFGGFWSPVGDFTGGDSIFSSGFDSGFESD
jgi:hypothetical protein